MIETKKFVRKPLFVDAVRVTTGNFEAIAAWCQGEIVQGEGTGSRKQHIKVRVHNPKIPRQAQAFVGDWLLYTERGYKVYTNKAFHASFDEKVEIEKQDFPYSDGGTLVLGPECFVSNDGSVLSWKGENYVPEAEKCAPVEAGPTIDGTTLPMDDSPAHAAAVEEIKNREEGVVTPPVPIDQIDIDDLEAPMEPRFEKAPQTEESANKYPSDTTIGGTPREEINVGLPETTPQGEPIEIVQATPEAIAELVRQNEQDRVAHMAEGKRVLSIEEQAGMSQDEIRDLLTTGEVILAQDLAA